MTATREADEVMAIRSEAALRRPFRAIVFDWDGTAVTNRHEDAAALAVVLGELLRRGVWGIVVTGTNFGHVDRQLCRHVPLTARSRLLVCANRGSEVFSFGRRGRAVRRWARMATPREEQALSAVAEAVRDAVVARTGLNIGIISDRLNRRKIDLIPSPEWADPPKERIGELLIAVEQRLRGAGLNGGLSEVIALTERLAHEHGLPRARITSDVKHVEVGLTDKGDALAWIKRHLLQPKGIQHDNVLVVGDEFGSVGGFAGSDDRLRAEADGASVVSVGAEPAGVPDDALHLGGGPRRFQALLADQLRLAREGEALGRPATRGLPADRSRQAKDWVEAALAATTDPTWRLEEEGYWPALEHEVESRCTIGNGALGVRGSLEQPTTASRPRTFVAGLFDVTEQAPTILALVPGPDWLRLQLALDGETLAADRPGTLADTRLLDLRRGVLLREWRVRGARGAVLRLRTLRLASLADRSLAIQLARLEVDSPARVELQAHAEPPLGGLEPSPGPRGLRLWRTPNSSRWLAFAMRMSLHPSGMPKAPRSATEPRTRWCWSAEPGTSASFARMVALARGDDEEDAAGRVRGGLRRAARAGFGRALAAHARAWSERWADSDIVVEGDASAQRALRFAAYHLISAANPEDERVSIGARALTGDAYLGHVFWDTEIFLLPFYTFTWPAAAHALLLYRHHTLPAAVAKAERLGYRGALYAWESADSGEETTPPYAIGPDGRVIPILCGTQEQHISADVAYAVWHYWQATEDVPFLLRAGAEMLLETARFWASRATLEQDGRFHIRQVIGPDEYHEGVDDNAYTNEMARWNLERGLEVVHLLAARWPDQWAALATRLLIDEDELARWRDVAERLAGGFDAASGLVEQFEGFFRLETVDLGSYAPRTAPMDVLLGPERTRRSQVIKQADVVMLLALLWERFPPTVRAANFRHYEPRCGHGSSLSPAVHALVAARLGNLELAERYFRQAAAIDLGDGAGNAALGVHIGALGGLWQAAVFGFGGLSLSEGGLRFDPRLPPSWRALRFPLQWRGRRLRVEMDQEDRTLTATLERGAPLIVSVGDVPLRLETGAALTCAWDTNGLG